MSGRILLFEGHRHAEALRLLPWLLNGTLADDERAWVERHVAGCSECRRECEAGLALQAGYRDADPEDPRTHAHADAVDAAWLRIRGRLHAPGLQPGGRRPLARAPWPPARWLGWAVAAQMLVIVALAATLWRATTPRGEYRTLGTAPAAAGGNLLVIFEPGLDAAQLQRLLAANEARIVDGPNAAGAYVVAVPPRRLLAAREALRAAPGVSLVATLGRVHAQ